MGGFGLRLPRASLSPWSLPSVQRFSAAVKESAFKPPRYRCSLALPEKVTEEQTVRGWKLSDFATPRGFGDCRWAGTVWNENKGRGLGRELGNGRLGRGLNAQTPRGSPPRHLAVGSACDLTWAQASLPSAPRPAVTK